MKKINKLKINNKYMLSLLKKPINQYLFIDIEVSTKYKSFDDFVSADTRMSNLWLKKSSKYLLDDEYKKEKIHYIDDKEVDVLNKIYFDKALLFPEFGKILTITIGYYILNKENSYDKRITSFTNDDELTVINEFNKVVNNNYFKDFSFFGHNIQGFDLPYIMKKFIFNKLALPKILNTVHSKPWELTSIDTMQLFKFGSYELMSFDLLTASLGIDSPKDELDGSMVNETYWHTEDSLNKIETYCKKDVNALMDVATHINELNEI